VHALVHDEIRRAEEATGAEGALGQGRAQRGRQADRINQIDCVTWRSVQTLTPMQGAVREVRTDGEGFVARVRSLMGH